MEWGILLTGIAIGLAVAAPIGPINLMCIQRALQHGFLSGLATGAGAVLGDGIFATISAFGLTWISDIVAGHGAWLQAVGGAGLVGMGWKTMRMPADAVASVSDRPWLHHGGLVGTTFLLTITNPATLFGFVAIFSGIGGLVAEAGNYSQAAQLVGAIMAGSLLWWALVSRVVSYFRERMSTGGLSLVNTASGLVILVFGAVVLVDLAGFGFMTPGG